MRPYEIASGIVLVAMALGVAACGEDLAGLNENPNAPKDVSAQLILPQAIQSAVDLVYSRGLHMNIGSLWAQHFAQIQYPDEDRYRLRPTDIDNFWQSFYATSLKDIQTIVEKGEETGNANHTAVGLILRSWEFGIVTDLWGDVPYSQALQAEKDNGTAEPAYDPQSEIYPALLADLERAVGMIDPGAESFGDEDLIYGGDMEAWRRFANSLRLRLAMRLSKVDPATAAAMFAAAADGAFASNDDNAVLVYAGSPPNEHPVFEDSYRGGRDDHAVSKTLIDRLLALSDPRIAVYADPIPADKDGSDGWTYIGWYNGVDDPVKADSVSRIGAYWRKTASAPAVLMSYAEVLFLKAEAAVRGWIPGDAAQLYADAIRASMEQYGISGDAVNAYLAHPSVAYNAATALEQIATQKWIALYGNGLEAYAEWRRTGYPALVPGPDNLNGDRIPRRLPYPTMEQNLNGANLKAAQDRQGDTGLNGRVWWDRS